MKKPDDSSRHGASKNDREARLAEALRANLRRRKAFAGKTASNTDSGTGNSKVKTEKPDG
ncbi:MAG: hypothetical protein EXR08_05510 [Alphaproteobacteria bacterium]|nr:hypothetical protein [Alphaproteobacteria bacterium]